MTNLSSSCLPQQQPPPSPPPPYHNKQPRTGGAYFLGKSLWAKGYGRLIDLLEYNSERLGRPFHMDVYGSGPDREAIEASAGEKGLDLTFHPATDHAELGNYSVFINPSVSTRKPCCAGTTGHSRAELWAEIPFFFFCRSVFFFFFFHMLSFSWGLAVWSGGDLLRLRSLARAPSCLVFDVAVAACCLALVFSDAMIFSPR